MPPIFVVDNCLLRRQSETPPMFVVDTNLTQMTERKFEELSLDWQNRAKCYPFLLWTLICLLRKQSETSPILVVDTCLLTTQSETPPIFVVDTILFVCWGDRAKCRPCESWTLICYVNPLKSCQMYSCMIRIIREKAFNLDGIICQPHISMI